MPYPKKKLNKINHLNAAQDGKKYWNTLSRKLELQRTRTAGAMHQQQQEELWKTTGK